MLAVSNHCSVFHMFSQFFHEGLLHDFTSHGSEADWLGVLFVLLFTVLSHSVITLTTNWQSIICVITILLVQDEMERIVNSWMANNLFSVIWCFYSHWRGCTHCAIPKHCKGQFLQQEGNNTRPPPGGDRGRDQRAEKLLYEWSWLVHISYLRREKMCVFILHLNLLTHLNTFAV